MGSWALGVVALAVAFFLAYAGWRFRRVRHERAVADPSVDPGAWALDRTARAALAASLSLPDPADRVRAVLEVSDQGELPWREALRALGPTEDPEILARLGRVEEALARCAALPPDHPGAAYARAVGYRSRGDLVRAEAALVAAVTLAGPADRPRYLRALERFRTRFPRKRGEAERLWDP